jgi:hypothetical protein
MLELGAIVFMVFAVWAALAAGMVMLKFLLTVLLLPLRVLVSILLLPLLLLKALLGGILMLVFLPIAAVGILLGLIALALVAVPLLPLAFLCVVIWFLVRASRPPALPA